MGKVKLCTPSAETMAKLPRTAVCGKPMSSRIP